MSAPTSESVAAELLSLSEQMDKVAGNMDELALVHSTEQPDHIEGGSMAALWAAAVVSTVWQVRLVPGLLG